MTCTSYLMIQYPITIHRLTRPNDLHPKSRMSECKYCEMPCNLTEYSVQQQHRHIRRSRKLLCQGGYSTYTPALCHLSSFCKSPVCFQRTLSWLCTTRATHLASMCARVSCGPCVEDSRTDFFVILASSTPGAEHGIQAWCRTVTCGNLSSLGGCDYQIYSSAFLEAILYISINRDCIQRRRLLRFQPVSIERIIDLLWNLKGLCILDKEGRRTRLNLALSNLDICLLYSRGIITFFEKLKNTICNQNMEKRNALNLLPTILSTCLLFKTEKKGLKHKSHSLIDALTSL